MKKEAVFSTETLTPIYKSPHGVTTQKSTMDISTAVRT
jgi:hypothetical protein